MGRFNAEVARNDAFVEFMQARNAFMNDFFLEENYETCKEYYVLTGDKHFLERMLIHVSQ